MANKPSSPPPTTATAAAQTSHDDRYAASRDVQLQILHEMQQINELSRKIYCQPPLRSKELWNFLLQFFGILAAFTFGVFAILAWKTADRANRIANFATDLASSANSLASSGNQLAATAGADAAVANVLAIWERCEAALTGTAVQTSAGNPCQDVLSAMSAQSSFYDIADRYFSLAPSDNPPGSATSDSIPTATPPSDSAASTSPGVIAGAVIGGIAGLALLVGMAFLPYQTYRGQLRRARELSMLKAEQEPS